MQYKKFFALTAIVMIVLNGCSSQKTENLSEISFDGLDSIEREEINYMLPTRFASDGKDIFFIDSPTGMVYRFDLSTKEATINCNNPVCSHDSDSCTAYAERDISGIRRENDEVYLLGNQINKISRNQKEEIGKGHYGTSNSKIMFGGYIAYPEEESIIVENIESGNIVQRFEDVVPYTQGNFYYKGALWYITEDLELVRLDIKAGEKRVVEEIGVTRASVYEDFIYYIQVDQQTGDNQLIRYSEGEDSKTVVEDNVFYYNIKGDTLYYTTWPDRDFYYRPLYESSGENEAVQLFKGLDLLIWSFPEYDDLLVNLSEDYYTYYILDTETNTIDYDHPLKVEQELTQ